MSKVISRLLASLLSAFSHFWEFRQYCVSSPFDHQLYDALVTKIWHICPDSKHPLEDHAA